MNKSPIQKRVWITRAREGAEKSADRWRKAGFTPIIKPLIHISPSREMPAPLPLNAVIILTSQNALRMLVQFTSRRHWPVIAVGDATASLAAQMGFHHVKSARGKAEDVISLIKKTYDPGGFEWFVYCSAKHIQVDIATRLRELGYQSRRDIYYENDPEDVAKMVYPPAVDLIAIYSAMAARLVARLPENQFSSVSTVSMSANIDRALGQTFMGRRIVADRPNEDSLLAAARVGLT